MSKHTPGPWAVSHDKKRGQQRISANDAPVAVTKEEANARLIAAAPDLLKALKVLVALHGNGPGDSVSMDNARGAIAKAEGRSS